MSPHLPPEAYEAARRNAESAPPPTPEMRAALRLIIWGFRSPAPAQESVRAPGEAA